MRRRSFAAAIGLALGVASPAFSGEDAEAQGHEHAPPEQTPQQLQLQHPPAQDRAHQAPPAGTGDQEENRRHGAASPMEVGMHAMTGAYGPYPMSRDAQSGTAWQAGVTPHEGVMVRRGDWTLMGHLLLNAVYDWQDGSRGDEKAFVSGMVMGVARRDFADGGVLNFRAMLSPDPFMGKRGYPLLLVAGESADGVTPLVDRQHPHELVMELSASYSHRLSDADSLFLYAAWPGEPAFGPPTFMHRLSAMDSPEAPISHHWLDSTHITFGVLTGGYVHGDWKVEASGFKGREPDEDRFDLENPKLDSAAVRLSWNPAERLALQASWADFESPEQLEPELDEDRWSASAIYTAPLGEQGWWSTMGAWARKDRSDGVELDAWVLEAAIKPNDRWTLFGRWERIDTDELSGEGGHGDVETVSKISFGAVHDWRLAPHAKVGLGGLYAFNFVPGELEPSYGGDPEGAMAFVRLKVE